MNRLMFGLWAVVFAGFGAAAANAQAPLGTPWTDLGQLKSGSNPARGLYDLRFWL